MNKYKQFSKSKSVMKEIRKRKSCASKKRFPTMEEAMDQAGMCAYKCSRCSGWHRTGTSIFSKSFRPQYKYRDVNG